MLLQINWQNFEASQFRSSSMDLNKIWNFDSKKCAQQSASEKTRIQVLEVELWNPKVTLEPQSEPQSDQSEPQDQSDPRDFLKNHLPNQISQTSQMKNSSQQLISSGAKRRERDCSRR